MKTYKSIAGFPARWIVWLKSLCEAEIGARILASSSDWGLSTFVTAKPHTLLETYYQSLVTDYLSTGY